MKIQIETELEQIENIQQIYINQQSERYCQPMQKQLECVKIKDAIYIGNIKTAQDLQFLITNKFAFVINCTSEIPNYYEEKGIKYLKIKLNRDKEQKIWDCNLKKIKKIVKFIQTCQQSSMCCLIHSYDGINRALVILIGYLMNQYRWKINKTLEFIRSKQIFIGLSQYYISELQKLQGILAESSPPLSLQWKISYRTSQEQTISNTYLNSLQIQQKQLTKKQKNNRRIIWKDLVEKQKKKQRQQLIKQQQKQRGLKLAQQNQNQKLTINLNTRISVGKESGEKSKKGQQEKFHRQLNNSLKKQHSKVNSNKLEIAMQEIEIANKKQRNKNKLRCKVQYDQQGFNEDNLITLIKKNLKYKKKLGSNGLGMGNENEQKIYNVTINNFIKPNINILNKVIVGGKNKCKKRPASAWKKSKPS